MGEILSGIYAVVKEEAGAAGQMRLTMMTGLIAPKAAASPDTPELISKFAIAFKEITGRDCPADILKEKENDG